VKFGEPRNLLKELQARIPEPDLSPERLQRDADVIAVALEIQALTDHVAKVASYIDILGLDISKLEVAVRDVQESVDQLADASKRRWYSWLTSGIRKLF